MGRGSSYQGVWEGEKAPPREFRIKDSFLEYIRKNTNNTKIEEIVLDEKDRIISIPYFKERSINCFSFFWKGKDLIFSNIYCKDGKFYIFNSWNGVTEPLEETSFVSKSNILTKAQCSFDEIGRKELLKNKKVDSKSANFSFLESYFKGEQFYSFKKNNSKKLKFLERKNKKN